MNDMSSVIIPKSDQINSDDLIAGPVTVTIREVRITPGSEQPVSMMLEGTDKAYRPCKSMSRVFVQAWGADAKAYVGRSVTLYRDPEVKWGGLAVGGIRISHMSDLDGPKTMVLTATKGSRKPHKVMPLENAPAAATEPTPAKQTAEEWTDTYIGQVKACATTDELIALQTRSAKSLAKLETDKPELHELAVSAGVARAGELETAFVG